MGKTRICGLRCHRAMHGKCRCWCGGLFHGVAGVEARIEFTGTFLVDTLPTTEAKFNALTQPDLFDEQRGAWRARVAAAVAAQKEGVK